MAGRITLNTVTRRCNNCVEQGLAGCSINGASAQNNLPVLTGPGELSWVQEQPYRLELQSMRDDLDLEPRPTLYPSTDTYPDGPTYQVPVPNLRPLQERVQQPQQQKYGVRRRQTGPPQQISSEYSNMNQYGSHGFNSHAPYSDNAMNQYSAYPGYNGAHGPFGYAGNNMPPLGFNGYGHNPAGNTMGQFGNNGFTNLFGYASTLR